MILSFQTDRSEEIVSTIIIIMSLFNEEHTVGTYYQSSLRPSKFTSKCKPRLEGELKQTSQGLRLSHITRKPVFGVCNQVKLKQVCSADETS